MQSLPRYPIVDTGPLFDFLLWRFSDSIKNPRLSEAGRYLKSYSDKRSLQWYFTVAKPIITCPQVIAEIHRHAQENKLRGLYLERFWRFAQSELKNLGLDENLIKLADMDSEILSALGPTNTALLQMACNSPDLSRPILTEDFRLAGQCRKREVSVLNIAQITALWQEFGSK